MSDPTTETSRILAPLDGSEEALTALPYAMALAGPGSELLLLRVVPVGDEIAATSGEVVVPADEFTASRVAEARAALEQAAATVRNAGHDAAVEVVVGDPARQILAVAAARNATMIVMASHGRGAVGRLIYGSVADTVAREATTPVLIARIGGVAPGPVGITRLVVPLDGSAAAEESLPVAEEISRRLGTPLFLVRAFNPAVLLTPAVGIGDAMPVEIYDETAEAMEKDARDYLEAVAARQRGQGYPVATAVLNGPPATAIIEATKPGDVVVLRSHGRGGLERWLVGSIAEQLVRADDTPVILVPAQHDESNE